MMHEDWCDLVLSASPAPAHPARVLRPFSWYSATKPLPYSGPSHVALCPEMLLSQVSGVPSWGLGLALLPRLWCVSYWEKSSEASWARVRWWFLSQQGVGTDKEQRSRPRLSSTLKVFLLYLSLHWPCPALYCPWSQATQFRAACSLAQSTVSFLLARQGLSSVAWWTLPLCLVWF